jgi:hypothetical protein
MTRYRDRPFPAVLHALAALGLTLSVAACSPTDSHEAPLPKADLGSCNIYLPPDAKTIVYSNYGAGGHSQYRFAKTPDERIGRQAIKVPKRDAPLFLIVSAYASTEWDLKIEPGAQIKAILAVGHEPQLVSHVPTGAKVAFSSLVGGAGNGCGPDLYDEDPLRKINSYLNTFGRGVDKYYRGTDGKCEMLGCGGDSRFSDEPSPSLWTKLFGGAEPEPPTNIVRTSAPLMWNPN